MKNITSGLLLATALSSAFLATAASAQETILGPIIVSAGLSPLPQNEMGRSYTVVDREQIERTKPAYMIDILRQVPGMSVSATGSSGGTTQVRLRGAEGNHVLVLIDGIPVLDNSSGEFDFGRLQVADVERVEVLRGPQSAFWGSDALAGVVNIITRSGSRNGFGGSVATEWGTDGTKMGIVHVDYGQDNFDIHGSVTARHTDGFNVSNFGSELDGATHFDANIKFNADVAPTLSIDGVIRYSFLHADTENFTARGLDDTLDTTRGNQWLGALGFEWQSEDGSLFQTGRISGTRVDRDTFDATGALARATTGDTYKASYQIGRHFATPEIADSQHTITLGYDLIAETFTRLPPSALPVQTRTTNSLVGEYRGTFSDQLHLTAAVRHDINEHFLNATTFSLSGAWDIPNTDTTIHSSIGTGTKNPSFVELFGTDPAAFVGNPDLIPETSLGWDVGVRQTMLDGMVTVDLTYFNQNLENEITTVYDASWTPKTVVNAAGLSTRQGVELAATLDLFNGFTASGSYTYTDSRDPAGLIEARRPVHTGVINLAYSFEEIPLRVNTEVVMVGESEDFGVTLPGYSLLNGGLNYQVNDSLEVYGRVHNLFDTSYQTAAGYNNPGRTFYVGAKAKF